MKIPRISKKGSSLAAAALLFLTSSTVSLAKPEQNNLPGTNQIFFMMLV